MSGFRTDPIASRRHASLFLGLGMIGTLLAVAACSGATSAQDQNAPIAVQTSQLSITIENKVGMPVTDIDVAIVPIGGATAFKKFIGRMENSEKREFPLGDFFGADGTPFNLRIVRPKLIRVTAKDLNNKPVTVETAWR